MLPVVSSAASNGQTLVGGRPGAVEVYELPGRTLRRAFDFGLGDVDAIAFAPDGLTLAVGGEGGLVVCDLA